MKRNQMEWRNFWILFLSVSFAAIYFVWTQEIFMAIIHFICVVCTAYHYICNNKFNDDTYYTKQEINDATRTVVMKNKWEFLILAISLGLMIFQINIQSLVCLGIVISYTSRKICAELDRQQNCKK